MSNQIATLPRVKEIGVKILDITSMNVTARGPNGEIAVQFFIHGNGSDGMVYKWNGAKMRWEVQDN